jgi:hypothetical protein
VVGVGLEGTRLISPVTIEVRQILVQDMFQLPSFRKVSYENSVDMAKHIMGDATSGCAMYSYIRKLRFNNSYSKNQILRELKALIKRKEQSEVQFAFPVLDSDTEVSSVGPSSDLEADDLQTDDAISVGSSVEFIAADEDPH